MKPLTFITSALLLSVAGVAAGMLFAPQKGSRTRRKISEKNHQYTDFLSDKFDDFIDSVSNSSDQIEAAAQRITDKALDKAKKVDSKVNSGVK